MGQYQYLEVYKSLNWHHRQFALRSDIITASSVERDLGNLVGDKLKFHASVIAKANKLLGIIILYDNADMIFHLYKLLVQSFVECVNVIWVLIRSTRY